MLASPQKQVSKLLGLPSKPGKDGVLIFACVEHGKPWSSRGEHEEGQVQTMSGNVTMLPVWKAGETAEEWFHEMALFARLHPERFRKVALVYEEDLPGDRSKNDYYCYGVNTTELLGLLELGKAQALRRVFE